MVYLSPMDNLKDSYARLVIHDLPSMKKVTVTRLAKWLRSVADDIEKSPEKYNKRFIARFMK